MLTMNDQEIIDALSELYSAVVADVLDALGFRRQYLSPKVHALTPVPRVCGRVFTVKAEAIHGIPDEPYKLEMEAVDSARAGDVLVVDANEDESCGFWGELLTTACLAKGVRGIVMTACTRDLWALEKLDFPVFGIGKSPGDSKGRVEVTALREPILLDGVLVKQGDYILGDCDGVVVVPQERATEVIRLCLEKVSGENTVRDELAAGVPVAEVFRRHGIL